MTGVSSGKAILAALLAAPGSAAAQTSEVNALSLGTAIGQALLIVLAVLVALSVLAKLAIVAGLVPREPENRFQALVHGAANFVGRLRPARSLRDQRERRRP